MTVHEQPYVPLLQRHGLRKARVRELWTSPPELEYVALSQWCRNVIRDNMHLLYDWDPDRETGWIQAPGIALARALNIEMPTWYSLEIGWNGEAYYHNSPTERILSTTEEDKDRVLDIIDYLLSSDFTAASRIDELHAHLRDGGSAWRVNQDNSGLTFRLSAEEEQSYRQATSREDSASQHITDASNAAWRYRDPNAKVAYSEAVNALEAILVPIVIPNESKPTLGKVIGELGAKHNKGRWGTRFRREQTVDVLNELLREIWETQYRHTGMPPNSLEQAQDAVTISVAVVALVRRGFLTRLDNS